jgi:malonyl-CoA O-methyltransferase
MPHNQTPEKQTPEKQTPDHRTRTGGAQSAAARAAIAARFGRAARDYDGAAAIQRLTARRLIGKIRACFDGHAAPRRILEFGCGTGFLTDLLRRQWPDAELIATDLSSEMLEQARSRCGDGVSFMLMDAAMPGMTEGLSGPFDLICGNLALQWVTPQERALEALSGLLAPMGLLAVSTLASGSFREWRLAHEESGVREGLRTYPDRAAYRSGWPVASGRMLSALRGLRTIGATLPEDGWRPLGSGQLRRVVQRFDSQGAAVSWDVAFGLFRRPPRRGVFVTGTDPGVGKTFVSACLTRAWNALYWKPLQTGLAEEEGDTPTVARLTGVEDARILPPADVFLAPLSPQAAAAAEGRAVDPDRLVLPMRESGRPLVVEGAGGLDVPVMADMLMINLMRRFNLPVILVARSGLGTVNHTLLSLEALRNRGVPVAGVVLNGPPDSGNRAAIEAHGQVRVLAEIPAFPRVDRSSVEEACRLIPDWRELGEQGGF